MWPGRPPPPLFFQVHLTRLMHLLLKSRLPAISYAKPFVHEGGLMSYVEYTGDGERRAAAYVDKILKGARPADLRSRRSWSCLST